MYDLVAEKRRVIFLRMEVGKIAKSDDTRINDEITASSCRLIGVDGSQLGLFAIRDRIAAGRVYQGETYTHASPYDYYQKSKYPIPVPYTHITLPTMRIV